MPTGFKLVQPVALGRGLLLFSDLPRAHEVDDAEHNPVSDGVVEMSISQLSDS